MKKSILPLSFLLLIIPSFTFSQDIYDNGLFTGDYASTYSNGKKKAAGRLEKNQRVGKWEFYGEDGELVAQIDYRSNTEFKTLETRSNESGSLSIPLKEYDRLFQLPLEEKNVSWVKRVYRDIPAAEFKLAPEFNFFREIQAIQTEKVSYFADSEFKELIEHASPILHSGETITGYRIKLDYFFRTDFNFMDFRIVGIAPLYQTADGNTNEICWIYYHGLKDLVFEKIVNKEGNSMEEILQTKNYHSTIYKESNIADKTVEEISKNEQERKAFYLEIDHSIIDTENECIIKAYL